MILADLVFYFFAFMVIFASVMVISVKNPVYSVLFLIFAFFNAAVLFLLVGAEFLAMILLIVYVGAIAVLFLFVVMMLDINIAETRQGFLKILPIGVIISGAIAYLLCATIFESFDHEILYVTSKHPILPDISNTQAIGMKLYTTFFYQFILSGMVLLLAMIGAIVLTLRNRPNVRKQNISKQNSRTKENSMKIVKVKSGEGVDGIIS
jgi:NADH-quinone oxidoreductase subunit J